MDILLFNFHDVVLMMTTYQCTLFALLLLCIHHENRQSNIILAGFLLTQALIPMDILISFGAGFREWAMDISPNLFISFGLAYWLEGPLLLWYTRSLIYKNYRLTKKDLLYVAPFAIYTTHEILSYFLLDSSTKMAILQNYDLHAEPFMIHAFGVIREVLRVVFGIMCLVEIHHCRRRLRDTYSNIEKIDFAWLKTLTIGFLIIRTWAVLVSLAIIFSVHMDISINYRIMGLTSNYTVFILISALIFLSLSYSSTFAGFESKEDAKDDTDREKTKLDVDPEMVDQLTRYMEEHKPYLAPILTLEQLATQLSMPQRTLSTIINRHFKRNFFEFINHYRTEEAKQLLADPSHQDQTVMKIMLDAGFNTKATFNTCFKKLVGLTPSQYRNQQLAQRSTIN